MVMQNFGVKQSGLVIAMGLLLTACGGGGGSSTTTSNSTQSNQPATQPKQPATTISLPTSATGVTTESVDKTDTATTTNQPTSKETPLMVLNAQRTTCGFSSLTNNDELVKASKNHNNYLAYISETSGKPDLFASHDEKVEANWRNTGSANPYFSGKSVAERVKTGNDKGSLAEVVNYPFATSYEFKSNSSEFKISGNFVSENISARSHANDGSVLVRSLLASPYHLKSLVSQYYKDVGVHFHQSKQWEVKGYTPITASYLTLVLGLQQGQAPQIANKTLSYPCNKIAGVEHTLTHEYPDPFAGHSRGNISKEKPIGQPVYIIAQPGKVIANISNISFKPINGVVAPKVWVMFQNANPRTNLQHIRDVHKRLEANEAFLIPDTKLQPATTYEVSYTINYTDKTSENTKFNFSTKSNI